MVDLSDCEAEYRKAFEKYRSAAPATPDVATVKRRWRIFLYVEAILLACLVSAFLFGDKRGLGSVFAGVLGTLVTFSLPVAVLYLIGKPPINSLGLDCPSAESSAMEKDVGDRWPLSDGEFHARFYGESPISCDTIARVRDCLRKRIDPKADRLVPSDYLPLLWEGLDFADVLDALGQEFRAAADFGGSFNGTLDSLIRLFHGVVESGAVLEGKDAARR